jgi:hypothetical protein
LPGAIPGANVQRVEVECPRVSKSQPRGGALWPPPCPH